eukprot:scaffold7681_cov154-Skeletonema_menzelii.AAC.5
MMEMKHMTSLTYSMYHVPLNHERESTQNLSFKFRHHLPRSEMRTPLTKIVKARSNSPSRRPIEVLIPTLSEG